jgi:hypothetical protein
MKILLGDFNAKAERENIFKPIIGNEGLYEISNDSGIRVVNLPHQKLTSRKIPHRNVHKYTWTFPSGKRHNHVDLALTDKRRHSSTADVRSFRGADCLVVTKPRQRLSVSKPSAQGLICTDLISKS